MTFPATGSGRTAAGRNGFPKTSRARPPVRTTPVTPCRPGPHAMTPLSRRSFLAASAGAVLVPDLWGADQPPARRPRVAAVYTVFRHRSHAQNILENFLQPYLFNGEVVEDRKSTRLNSSHLGISYAVFC